MTDAPVEIELTDIEQIEFNRRIDVIKSIETGALQLFREKAELDKSIKEKDTSVKSKWYWIAIVFGIGLNSLYPNEGAKVSIGFAISSIVALFWIIRIIEISVLEAKSKKLSERLFNLEIMWNGVHNNTFFELRQFIDINELYHDDTYIDWMFEQRTSIYMKVCGIERGSKIGKYWTDRDVNFRKMLRERNEIDNS
jgi:hypothetical protein